MKGDDEPGWHSYEQRTALVAMSLTEVSQRGFDRSLEINRKLLSDSFDSICQYNSLEELTHEIATEINTHGFQLINLIDKWDNFDEGIPFEYFTKPYRDAVLYSALAEKHEAAGNREGAQAFLNQSQYHLGLANAHSYKLFDLATRERRIAPLLKRLSELTLIKEKVAALLHELPAIWPKKRSRKHAASRIEGQVNQYIKENEYSIPPISPETLVTWMTREPKIRMEFEKSNSKK